MAELEWTIHLLDQLARAESQGKEARLIFLNPVPDGKALIATLMNPADLLAGKPPAFGGPIVLDLGGNGSRGMASAGQNYLLIAGPIDSGGTLMLYRWNGRGRVRLVFLTLSLATSMLKR